MIKVTDMNPFNRSRMGFYFLLIGIGLVYDIGCTNETS